MAISTATRIGPRAGIERSNFQALCFLLSARSSCRACLRKTTSTRSEEHTSELQSLRHLVCRLLLEKKKRKQRRIATTNQTTRNTTCVPTNASREQHLTD